METSNKNNNLRVVSKDTGKDTGPGGVLVSSPP